MVLKPFTEQENRRLKRCTEYYQRNEDLHRLGDYGIEDVHRNGGDFVIENEHRIGDQLIEDMHRIEDGGLDNCTKQIMGFDTCTEQEIK